MRNVVRIIFAISDLVAWLLLLASSAGAVLYPFSGVVHARMDNHTLSLERVLLTVFILIIVALGAYLLIRRKVVGLPLVFVPCIGWGVAGEPKMALWYGLAVVVTFITPLALSYIEMRQVKEAEHT